MLIFDGPVEPDDLTAFIREVPTPSELGLLSEFPRRDTDDNTVDFAEIVRTNRTARYRSFDGRIHVSKRDAGSEARVKLAPLSSSLSEGEYERLQREFARVHGSNQQLMAASVYNDAQNLTREVQNRLELAWGDTLTDGKLTIAEEGFAGEADYGVPGNQLVAPGTAWTTTATATVLTDILAWADVYKATNGVYPGSIKTSVRVLRLAQKNKEVIDAVFGATQGRTRVNFNDLNDVLASDGLPTFQPTYDSSVDVDGATVRTIPDDRLLMLPANLEDLGYTAWGVTATALELVNSSESDMSFEEAPGIVGVIDKVGPPYRQFVFVDAVAQPVLSNAKRLLVADVA